MNYDPNSSPNYDLHSHSTYSDGSLSPAELVALAAQTGVSHLALTDHDTIAGLAEAQLAAQKNGITLIKGVELSCTWQNQLLHIVGLNVDESDPLLQSGLTQNRNRRYQRADAMHEDFLSHNIDLRQAVDVQLTEKGVPTRPHFANALIEQGYAKDKKQAFKRYLVKGKPGFVSMTWPSLGEVGEWIKSSGGTAILAHPMRYRFTRTRLIRLIEDMRPAGIEGIEVSTPTTDKQQMEMLGRLCDEYGLLASKGSDFHSPDQPWARLGSALDLDPRLSPVWQQF